MIFFWQFPRQSNKNHRFQLVTNGDILETSCLQSKHPFKQTNSTEVECQFGWVHNSAGFYEEKKKKYFLSSCPKVELQWKQVTVIPFFVCSLRGKQEKNHYSFHYIWFGVITFTLTSVKSYVLNLDLKPELARDS